MNFGGAEVVYDYDRSDIIIVPVPYDETSTWMKGADRGPGAILNASPNLEFYDIETGTEVHKRGIYTLPPVTEKSSPEKLVEAVRNTALNLLKEKKFPVGGDLGDELRPGGIDAQDIAVKCQGVINAFDCNADMIQLGNFHHQLLS